jgi:hypothetical protein
MTKIMSKVPHRKRRAFNRAHPLFVVLRVEKDVGTLRTGARLEEIKGAFRLGCDRFGMRVLEFSIRDDRILLMPEADDQTALTRGIQGLNVRLARAINRASGRKGKVFAERYSVRPLKTVRAVRNAIGSIHRKEDDPAWHIDPFSTASPEARRFDDANRIVAVAKTALYQCAYYLEISRSAMRPKNLEAPW